MEGTEFDALVADIKAHGLIEPIVIYQNQILDGRNRYRACEAAGVNYRVNNVIDTEFDPLSFVISRNLKRRHLNESQRAMIAARLSNLKLGDNQHSEGPSIEGSSKLLNVGHASVERAKAVQRTGVPELVAAVDQGKISVSAAAVLATLAPEQQSQLPWHSEREMAKKAKRIEAERSHNFRIARIANISNGNAPLPQDRKYPIILADPPWKFEVYNDDDSGLWGAAASHYPTMGLADCKLPIADLATPDAALLMWTTAPHLRESFQVLDAWGFEYCTHFAWVKDKVGLGYWIRNQHELLLIAKRGDPQHQNPATDRHL
jgi:ParB-like chromosome segregation protein Spo0J